MTKNSVEPILPIYTFQYEIMKYAISAIKTPNVLAKDIHTFIIELIGSRLSGKTIAELRLWCIEFPLLCKQENVKVAINIFRYEPKGALETFEELLATAEDIYEIDINRRNCNMTQKKLSIGNGSIRAIGVMSNRKRKTPKLGNARKGAKKDIEVNIVDEITEFADEKTISILNQATGGATVNIRVKIANPWVLSMFYVKKFAQFLPFDEKTLRDKGWQYKQEFNEKKKTSRHNLITNHRINNYLSMAQHQELTDLWEIDETLARVADLGMPGVAEGLIYAPMLHKVFAPAQFLRVQEYRAGLDWGTSTNAGGSATAMVMGRIAYQFQSLNIDDEYYHSNSKQFFKDDTQLVKEIVDKLIEYIKANKDDIIQTQGSSFPVYYDYAAHALGGLLNAEIRSRTTDRAYAEMIDVRKCYKFDVPVRVDIVKSIISQGKYKVDKTKALHHWEELQGAMYDDTKKVNGRPTRLNEEDHTLDALEYLIGADLYSFADSRYIAHNKLI